MELDVDQARHMVAKRRLIGLQEDQEGQLRNHLVVISWTSDNEEVLLSSVKSGTASAH